MIVVHIIIREGPRGGVTDEAGRALRGSGWRLRNCKLGVSHFPLHWAAQPQHYDALDQTTLCCGGCPVYYRVFSSIPDPSSLDGDSQLGQPPSCDN